MCIRIGGRLVENVSFSLAISIDGRRGNSTALRAQAKVVDLFCYFDDAINAGGDCTHGEIAGVCSAWGKFRVFRELQLRLFTKRYIQIYQH